MPHLELSCVQARLTTLYQPGSISRTPLCITCQFCCSLLKNPMLILPICHNTKIIICRSCRFAVPPHANKAICEISFHLSAVNRSKKSSLSSIIWAIPSREPPRKLYVQIQMQDLLNILEHIMTGLYVQARQHWPAFDLI